MQDTQQTEKEEGLSEEELTNMIIKWFLSRSFDGKMPTMQDVIRYLKNPKSLYAEMTKDAMKGIMWSLGNFITDFKIHQTVKAEIEMDDGSQWQMTFQKVVNTDGSEVEESEKEVNVEDLGVGVIVHTSKKD